MKMEERTAIEGHSLLLFDGLCGMCHGVVRFLMHRDPSKRLLYAPLDSRLGKELLDHAGLSTWKGDGVVLIEGALSPLQTVWTRSDAAARTLLLLHGGWPLVGRVLIAVPRGLRDLVYRCFAQWRYNLVRAYEVCPIPSDEERQTILGIEG